MMDNQMILTGNVTADPEARFTTTGKTVAGFSIAHNTRKQVDGKWEDGPTSFFDITCWDQLAENVIASVKKGTRVTVLARARQESWMQKDENGAETDQKRTKISFVADEVALSLRWATGSVERNEKPATDASQTPFAREDIEDF